MKIAVCLSGHSRNYKDNYPNLSIPVDYFISSCSDSGLPNEKTLPFVSYHLNNEIITERANVDEIIELYKPKSFEFLNDKFIPIELKKFNNHKTLKGGLLIQIGMMFYRIHKANLLKKEYELINNFKYDFVIRSRFDVKVNSINLNRNYLAIYNKENSISDLFFMGSSHVMDSISECYLWFIKQTPDYLSSFSDAESILYYYIEYLKLGLKYSNDFDIVFNKDYPTFNYLHIKNGVMTYKG